MGKRGERLSPASAFFIFSALVSVAARTGPAAWDGDGATTPVTAAMPFLAGMSYASWVRDEMPQAIAWQPQTHPSSLGIHDVAIVSDLPRSGEGSLRMMADLHGGDDPTSQGEALIDTRYHNPVRCAPAEGCPAVPLNLCGQEIGGWIYCPFGSAGDPHRPNYLQVIVRSMTGQFPNETWRDYVGPAHNIVEGQWNWVSARPRPIAEPGAWSQDGFDCSRVAILSFKVGLGGGSKAAYRGPLYLDDVSWGTDACQPKFDFEETASSLDTLARARINAVALAVTLYQDNLTTSVIYRDPLKTTPDDRLTTTIQLLRARGFRVMLKPLVDVQTGQWRGEIDPDDKPLWFAHYRDLMLGYADIAQANGVEMFCVGNEFRALTQNPANTPHWEDLIGQLRGRFSGALTYGANWSRVNAADDVPFWGLLDFAGVSAYYPVSNEADPSLATLAQGWRRYQFPLPPDQCVGDSPATDTTVYDWVGALESWQASHGLPVVFTEIGCCSTDYAAKCPWFYCDRNAGCALPSNAELQKRFYQAAEQVFRGRSWFRGMFWWTWKPVADRGGLCDTDFTPQNKALEDYLTTMQPSAFLIR